VVSKNRIIQIAVLIVLGSALSMAQEGSQNQNPSSDAVMDALSHGVDHLNPAETGPELQRRDPRYIIGNGDVLDLQFQFTPEFDQTVTVQPDGFITLKEVGDLHIQGETMPQVRSNLQAAYSKILSNPVVSIQLKDFQKPYFLAFGEVGHPGKYDLRGDTTVTAALAMAGGLNSESKHSEVLLFRRVNDRWSSVTKLDIKHMLKTRNLEEDVALHPGDMLYVPQNTISKIKAYIPNPSMGMYAVP
jgi:polysaccharide biosynthesis/export protein